MPPFAGVRQSLGIPQNGKSINVVRSFLGGETGPTFQPPDGVISGVSRDSTGAALGGCTVDLFRQGDQQWMARTVSDGSGNYSFTVMQSTPWFVRFDLEGSPDRAGTTKNNIVGV